LTRVPVGRLVELGPADVASGAPFFPLVGGAVGAVCGLVADAFVPALPPLVAGALAAGLAAALTGALHLDALADTADALGGSSRERALEIMRDHAVGAFGVVALIVVLLVDAAATGAFAARGDAALACLGAGAAGRAVMLPLARALPYARAGAGQGRVIEGATWLQAGGAVVLGAALAVPYGAARASGLAPPRAGAVVTRFGARAWRGRGTPGVP